MPAKTCTVCSISVPQSLHQCPLCGRAMKWEPMFDPTPDWEERVDHVRASGIAEPSDEARKVEAWRLEQVMNLGYSYDDADMIIHRRTVEGALVDIRELQALIDKGCPPPVAAKILV